MDKFKRLNKSQRIKIESNNNEENIIKKEEHLIKERLQKIWRKNIYNILGILIISFINASSLFCNFNKNLLFKLSEVSLTINGTGNIKILSDNFFKKYNKCDIYINDSLQNIASNEYDFNSSEYIYKIKIIWNDIITTAGTMFAKCSNIIEIDLSNFNSSLVNDMQNMFYECKSLISLNLSNFNTLKVVRMNGLPQSWNKIYRIIC